MEGEALRGRLRALGPDFVEFEPTADVHDLLRRHPLYGDLFTMTGLRPSAIVECVGRPLLYLIDREASRARDDGAVEALRFRLACRGDRAYLLILDDGIEILPCDLVRRRGPGTRVGSLSLLNIATLARDGLPGLCREKGLATPVEDWAFLRDRLPDLLGALIRDLRELVDEDDLMPIGLAVELLAATLLIRKSLDTLGSPFIDQPSVGPRPAPVFASFRQALSRLGSRSLRFTGVAVGDLPDLALAALLPLLTGVRPPSSVGTGIGWRDLDFRHIAGIQIAEAFAQMLYVRRADLERGYRAAIQPSVPFEVADFSMSVFVRDVEAGADVVDSQAGTGLFVAALLRQRALAASPGRGDVDRHLVAMDPWPTHLALTEIVIQWTLLDLMQAPGAGHQAVLSAQRDHRGILIGRMDPRCWELSRTRQLETDQLQRLCPPDRPFAIVVLGSLLHSFESHRRLEREHFLSTVTPEAILDFSPVAGQAPFASSFAVVIGVNRLPTPEATGVFQPAPRLHHGRIGLGDDSVTVPYALSELRDRSWMLRALALGGGPEARVLDRLVSNHLPLSKAVSNGQAEISQVRSGSSSEPGAGLNLAVTPRFSRRDLDAVMAVTLSETSVPNGERIVIRSESESWLRHIQHILRSSLPAFWLSLMTGPDARLATRDFTIRDLVGLPIAGYSEEVDPSRLSPDAYVARLYGLGPEQLEIMQRARRRSFALRQDLMWSVAPDPDQPDQYARSLNTVLSRLHPGRKSAMARYLGPCGPWSLFFMNRGAPVDLPNLDRIGEDLAINAHLDRQLIPLEGDACVLARPARASEFRDSGSFDDVSRYLTWLADHDRD